MKFHVIRRGSGDRVEIEADELEFGKEERLVYLLANDSQGRSSKVAVFALEAITGVWKADAAQKLDAIPRS